MFVHISFVTLISALSAFGTPINRDGTQVSKDIQGIKDQTNSLDRTINNLPNSGATLAEAMTIHNEAIELGNAIQNATADVTASPEFSTTQATDILGETQTLTKDIRNALQDLDNKKPVFEALKLDPIVADDLKSLGDDTRAFEEQFMEKIPTSMASVAQAQATAIFAALETAEDTYAS